MEFLFVIALVPVVLLLTYIYKKDVDKEPRGLLTRLFIFGGVSVVPIAILELIIEEMYPTSNLPTFTGTFLSVFVGIALIEEFGKWIIIYLCTYRRREFNHAYDGIVYAVFSSLGFAAVENVLYVAQSGVATGLFRAVTAVPGHAVDAVFMGYFFSLSKDRLVKKDNKGALLHLLLSILAPVITHTIYDSIIMHYVSVQNDMYIALFFGFVILTYVIGIILIKKHAKIPTNFDGSPCVDTSLQNKQYVINNNQQQVVYSNPSYQTTPVVFPTQAYQPVQPVQQQVPVQPVQSVANFCPHCGGRVVNNRCVICNFEVR